MARIYDPPADPRVEVRQSVARAVRDEQELKERAEEADALGLEDEKHLVDYCMDCVRTSERAMEDLRKVQAECLRVFNEEPPPNYAKKEDWQSKVVLPKPYATVLFAQAVVRKAFDTELLSVENEADTDVAERWKKLMQQQLAKNVGNFPTQFSDASQMAFAIGQSLEIIPTWNEGTGLDFILVEPWKIHRDPDAVSRKPQSGMYWIHQEYVDYYALKKLETEGRYTKIGPFSDYEYSESELSQLSQDERTRKLQQVKKRSKFRKMVLVYEFRGTILNKSASGVLLPNGVYTIAGDKVIGRPKVSPYNRIRWPGTSFSPLPKLLRYDGRGLLEGVRSLWYLMCSLMCLHTDQLNFIVNPPTEINVDALVDAMDYDIYPGKQYLTRGTTTGAQAVRPVNYRFQTGEILANEKFADECFQRGTVVTDPVQGLPGYRAEVTARESAQNLEQSLNVFGLMGKNIEDGALNAILAAADTITAFMGAKDLERALPGEDVSRLLDAQSPTGIKIPPLTSGAFHVSGVSTIMRDRELMATLAQNFLPLFEKPAFAKYMKPYKYLKAQERRLNLSDEGVVVTDKEAEAIDEATIAPPPTEQSVPEGAGTPVEPTGGAE